MERFPEMPEEPKGYTAPRSGAWHEGFRAGMRYGVTIVGWAATLPVPLRKEFVRQLQREKEERDNPNR